MTISDPAPVEGPQPPVVPPEEPPVEELGEEPESSLLFGVDSFGDGSGASFFQLSATRTIQLAPGGLSLLEWAALISEVIQNLRESLTEAQIIDLGLRTAYYREIISLVAEAVEAYNEAIALGVDGLTIPSRWSTFNELAEAYETYNVLMTDVSTNDQASIEEMNSWFDTYNTLVEGGPEADTIINDLGGGDVQVVLNMINAAIDTFNTYVATRPDLQAAIDAIIEQTTVYNESVEDINKEIVLINEDQETTFPLLEEVPIPDINPIFSLTLDAQLELPILLNPTTIEERLGLYVQPLTLPEIFDPLALPTRIDALQIALLNQAATPEEEALVQGAIASLLPSAVNGDVVYANEGEFLTAVRNLMDTRAQNPAHGVDPNRGLEIFDQGIVDLPIRGLIPNPVPGNGAEMGLVTPLTPITGVPESIQINKPKQYALELIWEPVIGILLPFLAGFTDLLTLGRAFVDAEHAFNEPGYSIIFPALFADRAAPVFLENVSSTGSGVGLTGFSIGLHSNFMESALSTAILFAVALNGRFPISFREFAQLQFTALELMYMSSLLSAVPAARFLASSLGTQGTTSQMVSVAVALAFGLEIISLVNSNVLRALVNGMISRLSLGIRSAMRNSLEGVVRSEKLLNLAIETGNPGFIRFALSQLVHAHLRLASVTRLFNTFGMATIGGLSAFTRATASTLNLSMLSIALTQFGRAIGLPGFVLQMFANFSGMPMLDILVAMSAGSRIADVLSNPISMLFIKQTLLDTLVFRLGLSSAAASSMINNAINNIIAGGGINSFSHLHAELVSEFQSAGFSLFVAHLIANETISLIRGDLGVQFLNVTFGLNFDSSIMASSIVNNIYGYDIGVAGSLLSNTVIRGLLFGGFGTRVRLIADLQEQFMALGLNEADAAALGIHTVDFLETLGVLIPFNRYPSAVELILGTITERAVVYGSEFDREEFIEKLQKEGLSNAEAKIVAEYLEDLIDGSFEAPDNLLEIAVEEAIKRTILTEDIETQREFRNIVVEELRNVGFSRAVALFLGNSAAIYGVDGTLLYYIGVNSAHVDRIRGKLTEEAASAFGISLVDAASIVDHALDRTLGIAPFSSEDDFITTFKEEFFAGSSQLGHVDGHIVFDHSIAGLLDPTTVLGANELAKEVDSRILEIFGPHGANIRDELFVGLFGTTAIGAMEDDERRRPQSFASQLAGQVSGVFDQGLSERPGVSMVEHLRGLGLPHAVIELISQSISNAPTTLIGNLDMSPTRPATDMPV